MFFCGGLEKYWSILVGPSFNNKFIFIIWFQHEHFHYNLVFKCIRDIHMSCAFTLLSFALTSTNTISTIITLHMNSNGFLLICVENMN